MEGLNSLLKQSFGFEMNNDFVQRAVYSAPMDCVTYLSADVVTISDRIDEFLTVMVDASNTDSVVGFKVKGFRHFFSETLQPKHNLSEGDFIPLVSVLEEMLTQIGGELTCSAEEQKSRRANAYCQAKELAERDNVNLNHLPKAA